MAKTRKKSEYDNLLVITVFKGFTTIMKCCSPTKYQITYTIGIQMDCLYDSCYTSITKGVQPSILIGALRQYPQHDERNLISPRISLGFFNIDK